MALNYPEQGRNYVLDVAVNNGNKIANWYILLFENDYTPQESDTAQNIVSRAGEIATYAEGTRPVFTVSTPTGGGVNNQGNIAQVTLNAAKTVRGFAIVSSAGKGTSTGTLLAVQRLDSARAYNSGDVVKIPATLLLANVA